MTLTAVKFEDGTTLTDRVLEWTEQLCESLEKNYRNYHERMIRANSNYFEGELSEYAKKQIAELEDGTAKLMKFKVVTGKKYYKIIQQDYDTFRDRNEYRDGSVNAFIDKKTGEVYKPASWKSPAKHVRFDMRLIKDRTLLNDPNFTDWAGGYLYMR